MQDRRVFVGAGAGAVTIPPGASAALPCVGAALPGEAPGPAPAGVLTLDRGLALAGVVVTRYADGEAIVTAAGVRGLTLAPGNLLGTV